MNPEDNGVDEAQLDSAGQMAIRQMVRSLPEETVSMAWRSSLNEQLLAVAAKKQKRRRLIWFASPAAGLSLATALVFVVMFHSPSRSTSGIPDRGIESAILTDHHNMTLTNEVTTTGLNLTEVTTEANESDPEDGIWSEADVESL